MSSLQSDADRQILLLRFRGGIQNLADSRRISRDRFFHKNVLSGLDGRIEMDGSKSRRGGKDYQIAFRGQCFLISVKTDELSIFWDIDFPCCFLLKVVETLIEPILERVGHRDKLHATRSCQRLAGCAAATSATADEGNFDRVVNRRRVRLPSDVERSGQRTAHHNARCL